MTEPTYEFDLRPYTQDSDKLVCTVTIVNIGSRRPWLICGEASLRTEGLTKVLFASLKDCTTDFEHDGARAFAIRLVGVEYSCTHRNSSLFEAYIAADESYGFYIPTKGLNPFREAIPCPRCEGEDAHLMVPRYVPPENVPLWEEVRGQKVEISIGLVR